MEADSSEPRMKNNLIRKVIILAISCLVISYIVHKTGEFLVSSSISVHNN